MTRYSEQIQNLEIEAGEGIDIVGSVEDIPVEDESFDVIISQEVLEHVADPFKAISEISRVLKPDGVVYLQLPFIIGYHGCPDDYWRFTHQGISQLAKMANLRVVDLKASVGAATGLYRISVEFFAILFSLPLRKSYRPLKGIFSLILYPLKWFDPLLALSPESHRIEGGYFVVLRK